MKLFKIEASSTGTAPVVPFTTGFFVVATCCDLTPPNLGAPDDPFKANGDFVCEVWTPKGDGAGAGAGGAIHLFDFARVNGNSDVPFDSGLFRDALTCPVGPPRPRVNPLVDVARPRPRPRGLVSPDEGAVGVVDRDALGVLGWNGDGRPLPPRSSRFVVPLLWFWAWAKPANGFGGPAISAARSGERPPA